MGSSLKYFFNDKEWSGSKYQVSSPEKVMKIRVELWGDSKIATLNLEPLDFIWNHPDVNQPSNFKNGQKGAIV